MACDIDDREGESPSPLEPRLGRMSHSSATGRRRERIFPEALGLRQALIADGFDHRSEGLTCKGVDEDLSARVETSS
jgi:hypothetical protein